MWSISYLTIGLRVLVNIIFTDTVISKSLKLLQLKCVCTSSFLCWATFHETEFGKPSLVETHCYYFRCWLFWCWFPIALIKVETFYGLDDLHFTLVWARWLVWRTTKSKIHLYRIYNFLFFFFFCFSCSCISMSFILWTFLHCSILRINKILIW